MGHGKKAAVQRPGYAAMSSARGAILWLLLFLICFGLGYPTLNRYDPRMVGGTSDSAEYYKLVKEGPQSVEGHVRFRVLVPYSAKPFYRLAKGHLRTWEPVFFGLLVANASLTATTVYFLVAVGSWQTGDLGIALLGGMLYLLNFATANLRLAGLVDSGEGCFLMAITWALTSRRWWLLPLFGVLGGLAKESFVPFSIVFASTWWLVSSRQSLRRFSQGVWIVAMAATGLATVAILQLALTRQIVWPWEFAASLNSRSNYAANLARSIADRNFWYIFIWLLPLGVLNLRRLPHGWVLASATTAFLAFLLAAYYKGAPGTAGRAVFSIVGPILSLSTAVFFCGLGRVSDADNRRMQ